MKIKKLFPLILACSFSVPVLAADDELEEITLDEKIDTLQEKVETAQNRYQHAERQHDRLQAAEEVSDYVDVVKKVKVFD
jgi:hypothetical protein